MAKPLFRPATYPNRGCTALTAAGRPCGSPALRGEPFCRMHHPDCAEVVAEARRLGGLRRRKELTISLAYDLGDPGSPDYAGRILEIATADTLALANSVARNHTLIMAAKADMRLIELFSHEARIAALEDALRLERQRSEGEREASR